MAVSPKSRKKSAVKPSRKTAGKKKAKPAPARMPSAASRAAAMIEAGRTIQAEALEVFDALPVTDMDFMYGRWQGSGLHTDHAMDGLLENYAWYGKEFIDPDNVHPLLFTDGGGNIFKVNPALMPMGIALKHSWPKFSFMRTVFRLGKFILSTRKTTARLRMTEHRGKVSATMCYDALPIHDVFRTVDENTLMGLMDFKGMDEPFFFVLKRVQE